ncbi:hypothetical protein [Burkholderia gladioli]|uniref:hypothetical protein n=1 Tax=Burkholderia gladioli TaxID=28095 RepID=UPI00163F6D17|nr:hypothetical protein [Burkholderia gladioli]
MAELVFLEKLQRGLREAEGYIDHTAGSDKVVKDDGLTLARKKREAAEAEPGQDIIPLIGELPPVPEEPPPAIPVSARKMDGLALRGGKTSNGWSRWEQGTYVPRDDKVKNLYEYFPGREVKVRDGTTVLPGLAQLFWEVGPCWDDDARPVPLWAMLEGKTDRDSLWRPVLRYTDGRGADRRSLLDVMDQGAAFVRSRAQPRTAESTAQTVYSKEVARTPSRKPGERPAPFVYRRRAAEDDANASPSARTVFPRPMSTGFKHKKSAYDGSARTGVSLEGRPAYMKDLRPLFDPDLPPAEQVEVLESNELHLAQIVSERWTPEEFVRALALTSSPEERAQLALVNPDEPHAPGTAEPDLGRYPLYVSDVLVMALGASFMGGDRRGNEWQRGSFEDRVFALLRMRHRRIVHWASQFGLQAGVRRWLRRIHSDYLFRQGYAWAPSLRWLLSTEPEERSIRVVRRTSKKRSPRSPI